MSTRYDVIVIGTGAGGETLVYRLVPHRQTLFDCGAGRLSTLGKCQLDSFMTCTDRLELTF